VEADKKENDLNFWSKVFINYIRENDQLPKWQIEGADIL
jgi:hypothetical protein